MGAKLQFTLICDDARTEVSNKLIVIGLYNYSITFPRIPEQQLKNNQPVRYALPQLCLVRRWLVDSPGNSIKTELIDPDGKVMQLAERELRFPAEDNLDQEIINVRGILLVPGRYTVRTTLSGTSTGTLEDTFEVRVI